MTSESVPVLSTAHPVYPDGPPCNPHCPGEHSQYHDGYADGYEMGENATSEARIAVLEGALREIVEADDAARRYDGGSLALRLGNLLTATFAARTALSPEPKP